MPDFRNRSQQQVKQEIKKLLSQTHKEQLGVKGIKEKLIPFLRNYIGKRYAINGEGISLYRIRINEDKGKPVDYFQHTDQLGAPPNPTWKGRCNDIGERVLYCSNHPVNCLAELKGLKEGDFVSFIIYVVKPGRKIEPVSFAGVDVLKKNDNLLRGLIENFYGDLINDPAFPLIQMVDKFMADEFALNVDKIHNDNVYNSTIAWKQLCFERSHSKCLIYPSASSLLRTANLAIDPDYANQILTPIEAHRYRIIKILPGNTDFVIQRDSQANLTDYGEIKWEQITVEPESITHRRVSEDPFEIPT